MIHSLISYVHIILSSICIYIFVVVAIRLFGKKELAQLSVVDLVFILLISNSVQNAMVGSDSTLLGGIVSAGSLFIVNGILKKVLYKSSKLSKIIQGESILLIYNGALNHRNLDKAMITIDELMEALREHGVAAIRDVDLAVLEVDGNISILSDQFKRKTIKKRKTHKVITKNQQ